MNFDTHFANNWPSSGYTNGVKPDFTSSYLAFKRDFWPQNKYSSQQLHPAHEKSALKSVSALLTHLSLASIVLRATSAPA